MLLKIIAHIPPLIANAAFHWSLLSGSILLLFALYIVCANKTVSYASLLKGMCEAHVYPALIIAAVVYTVLLSLNKSLQYAYLQNQVFDLGLFTDIIYNTSRGQWFNNSIIGINYLFDHFSPGLIIFVPLITIFKSPVILMIAQSIALGSCIPAAYFLARSYRLHKDISFLIAILFVSNPYIHQVHRYDFHFMVFAIPLFICLMIAEKRNHTVFFWTLVVMIAAVREDAVLMLVAIGVWFAIFNHTHRLRGLTLAVISAGFFCCVFFIIKPQLGAPSMHSSYNLFYAGFTHACLSLYHGSITDSLMFLVSRISDVTRIKPLLMIFGSFLFLPLFSRKYILLLILPIAINVFSDFSPMYLFLSHYVALMLPFLLVCTIEALRTIFSSTHFNRLRNYAHLKVLFILFLLGMYLLHTRPYVTYEPGALMLARWQAIDLIPRNAIVSAQTNCAPPLIIKSRISVYPEVNVNTEYILTDTYNQAFVFPKGYLQQCQALEKKGSGFTKIFDHYGVKVFLKAHPLGKL